MYAALCCPMPVQYSYWCKLAKPAAFFVHFVLVCQFASTAMHCIQDVDVSVSVPVPVKRLNEIAIDMTAQVKGTVSSRSEQTFNRAWNRCPGLRWTQWLKITGSFMQEQRWYDLIVWGIIFQSLSFNKLFSRQRNNKMSWNFHRLVFCYTSLDSCQVWKHVQTLYQQCVMAVSATHQSQIYTHQLWI